MIATAAEGLDAMSFKLTVALLAVASLVVVVAGFSTLARRLLGIRVGALRALCAGLVGLGAVTVFNLNVRRQEGMGALSGVQFAVAVLAAMATLVLVEVFLPHGSWASPVRLWRTTRGRIARTRRYLEISGIFMRHGFGRLVRGSAGLDRALRPDTFGLETARSLRLALEECGGAFIKVGQLLSTRRDLMPPHFIEELRRLQSNVPPTPWPEVEAVLRAELARPVEEVFAWVEREPLAAASIAQVHRAQLRGGPVVVLKIQRAGIRESVQRDLDIVVSLTRRLQSRSRSARARAMGLRELGEGFARSVREELDFRIEARNSEAVASSCGGLGHDAHFRIPRVHYEFTTAALLVQEWLQGVTLDAAGPVAERRGLDRHAIARTAFGVMLHQILRVGVFHADPHPGNILLLDDGRLGLLDFGSVGRIDPSVRQAIQEMLMAVDRGDPAGLHDALMDLLGSRAAADELLTESPLLERELGQFMAQHLGHGARPDTEMFTALFQIFARFGLAVPPDVAAVFRALATVEGALTHFAPDFNMLDETRAIGAELLADQLRFGVPGPWRSEERGFASEISAMARGAAQEMLAVLPMLRRLPRRAERITASLEEGRLAVRVRLLADERERRFVAGLIHQMTVALLAACTGLMGVLLVVFGTGRGPRVTRQLELFPLLGYQVLAVSAILMLRALYTAMRRPVP